MRAKIFLKVCLALFVSWAFYCAVDFFTIQKWNNNESLIIRLVSAGPESIVPYDNQEDETYTMLERDVVIMPLSNPEASAQSIKVVRLKGSGVDLIPGRRYLLVWDMFEDGTLQYSIADAFRVPSVAAFVITVCLVLIALTGRRGLLAILGLAASIAVLLLAMIPLIVSGWPPVALAVSSVLIISTVTVLCVVRHARYRFVALLGSLGGVLCGFGIGAAVVYFWQLTGLAGEGSALLASTLPEIDMRGILLSSILVGAIGAVLDVAVSITASMSEFIDYDSGIPLDRLLLAGLNVGSEVLGSMINTLILAYLGSSLPMTVLIASAGVNVFGLLNDPYIGQEIVQSLAGTLGLLFTIPATAFFFVLQEGIRRRDE